MKNKKSHIVFLTPGFAASEFDSTNIPALQVYLKSLKKTLPNTKMTLLSFQFPYTKKPYNWNGITIIPLNGKSKHYKKIWTWLKALQTLKNLHKENPITNLHSFWIGESSFIANRFSQKHNINHVTTVMGQDANLGNKYVNSIINSNTKIVTLSKNHEAILLENYKLKSTIVPWFLDLDSFPKLQEKTIDILGVGSLNEIKNYSLFLNLIANLVKSHANLKVEIIGEGKQRTSLEKQIKDLNLTNNVKLLGNLDRKQVLLKMSHANILLHTSIYESFGLVFLEALYSSMQIISFNVGIASPSPKWKVCKSKKNMITACIASLAFSENNKKRILLTKEETSISSYLKIYNE